MLATSIGGIMDMTVMTMLEIQFLNESYTTTISLKEVAIPELR